MSVRKLLTLAVLGLSAIGAHAADQEPIVADSEQLPGDAKQPVSPTLNVQVDTTFADAVFGVKLVNGHATSAHISIINGEPEPINVRMVGGSLWNLNTVPKPASGIETAVRNLTTKNYNVEIPAGENATVTYGFATELHPQDLRLLLAAVIMDTKGNGFQVEAYNQTVSIVEAPISIFDPQMLFLYVLLGGLFVGTLYFIYNTWVKTLFPQTQKPRTKRERKPIPVSGGLSSGDEKATASGSGKGYDESWIPAQHLQRPEARRVRSGTPKTKAK